MSNNSNTISSLPSGSGSTVSFYESPFKIGFSILRNVDKKILLLPLDRFGIVKQFEKHDWVFKASQFFVGILLCTPLVNYVVLPLFEGMRAELSFTAHSSLATLADQSQKEFGVTVQLSDTEFTRILEAIKEKNALEKLTLTQGVVNDQRTSELAELLQSNTSLLELNLSSNKALTSTGAKRLADSLKFNTTLKKLRLNSCSITRVGAEALVASVKDRESPPIIELWSNQIQ